MNALKAIVPALVLFSACKNSDECKLEQVEVTVIVADTSADPVDAMVDIDGTPCAGSNGSYTCLAITPTEDADGLPVTTPNQVTATNFPFNQPAAQRVPSEQLAGPDCETISMELRMLPAQK